MRLLAALGVGFAAGLVAAGFYVGRQLAEGRAVGGYTWTTVDRAGARR